MEGNLGGTQAFMPSVMAAKAVVRAAAGAPRPDHPPTDFPSRQCEIVVKDYYLPIYYFVF